MHSKPGLYLLKSSRIKSVVLFLLVIGGLLALWKSWIEVPAFPLDDAYIVQHTVAGIWSGRETRFLDSNPMDGSTSPAHVLFILILSTLMPIVWAQVVAMTAGASLYLTGIYALARQEGVDAPWSRIIAAYSAMLGLTLYQLLNGLETSLAMAAIAWTLFLFRNPQPKNPSAYIVLGVLPFIRPELVALSGLFYMRSIWEMIRAKETSAAKFKCTALCALGSVPFMLFLAATTGSPIPNTVAAKLYFFAEGCLPLGTKFSTSTSAAWTFLTYLGLGSLGFLALVLTRARYVAIFFIAIFWITYSIRLPGALQHNEYRYLHLLVPFAISGWITCIAHRSKWIQLTVKIILFVAIVSAGTNLIIPWRKYTGGINFSKNELFGTSVWVLENIPADATILIHDAGHISTVGSQRLVDLVGLKTLSSVEIHRRYTWTSCSRSPEAIQAIAVTNDANYLIVLTGWDRIFQISAALKHFNWSVERADTERGESQYKVYRISPPINALNSQ